MNKKNNNYYEKFEGNEKWVMEEIVKAYENKIPITINDTDYYSIDKKELSVVLESGTYMKDYIGDEDGKIIGVGFYRLPKK